jgi:hypothetical protein
MPPVQRNSLAAHENQIETSGNRAHPPSTWTGSPFARFAFKTANCRTVRARPSGAFGADRCFLCSRAATITLAIVDVTPKGWPSPLSSTHRVSNERVGSARVPQTFSAQYSVRRASDIDRSASRAPDSRYHAASSRRNVAPS